MVGANNERGRKCVWTAGTRRVLSRRWGLAVSNGLGEVDGTDAVRRQRLCFSWSNINIFSLTLWKLPENPPLASTAIASNKCMFCGTEHTFSAYSLI